MRWNDVITSWKSWQQEQNRKKDIQAIKYNHPYFIPEFGYPPLDGTLFYECEQEAKEMIQTLNLDIQSKQVLDGFIRLRALEIFYKKVLSLRLDNHRVSLASRSEKVLELETSFPLFKFVTEILRQSTGNFKNWICRERGMNDEKKNRCSVTVCHLQH